MIPPEAVLAIALALLLGSALTLGWPAWGQAVAFMTDAAPTSSSALGILNVLLWLVTAMTIAGLALAVPRALVRVPENARRVARITLLLAGLSALLTGMAHVSTGAVTMGGGSVSEAARRLGH
jgi:hypothetical protein